MIYVMRIRTQANEMFPNFEFLQERFRAVDEAVSELRRFLEGTIVEVRRNFDKVRSASAMVEERLDQGDRRLRDLAIQVEEGAADTAHQQRMEENLDTLRTEFQKELIYKIVVS